MKSLASIPARVVVNDVYYGLVQHFPRASKPLAPLAAKATLAMVPAWRRALQANARLALGPNAADAEVERVSQQMMHHMQRVIAEVLQAQRHKPDQLAARVTKFSGQDAYHQARAQRRGLVVASAHMGSFEPCLALLRRFEARIHVLYQPDPMPRFERARSALRRSLGVIEHRADAGVAAWAELQDALRANEVVVLHADRALPFQRGSRMTFLGADDAMLPTGPVRLALTCGSALVPTFCYANHEGLEVQMLSPILCEEEALRSAQVAEHPAQRALLRAMERAILARPEQWMAFVPIRERDQ